MSEARSLIKCVLQYQVAPISCAFEMCPKSSHNVPSGLPGWVHLDTILTADVGVGVGVGDIVSPLVRVEVEVWAGVGLRSGLRLGRGWVEVGRGPGQGCVEVGRAVDQG